MKLVFLGTSGFQPTDHRHTSCLLLPEIGVAFDAGTGMYRVKKQLKTEQLQLFLSHAHLDHIVGLTYLLPEILYGQIRPAKVYGEAEKLTAIREHLFSEHIFPVQIPYEWNDLTEPVEIPEDGVVSFRKQPHPGGSFGFRVDWPDRSMAYITDTTADGSEESIEFVRGVDVLIHECDFGDENAELAVQTGHSYVTPVAETAKAADVGRLLLTHFDPFVKDDLKPIDVEVARKIFPETELAEDMMVIEF
ncbi:MBL fold metallo-hydrolase [Calycomorphotria hydatis]|uniref:Ribonuclease BN n=1 Tax=Calycomorphotria hydatis TaxID=2528027 RepID=A0A517TCV6_9PLAN|nr:MBL fold metallo-hydrolase [Calycomorphotria hydatis]QDT66204.1 Ribonuclease BN [Calycomorphotria hydatis]